MQVSDSTNTFANGFYRVTPPISLGDTKRILQTPDKPAGMYSRANTEAQIRSILATTPLD